MPFPILDAAPPPAELPSQAALPDPLTMQSGERVTTREQWLNQRAPELRRLFAKYEYGFQPPAAKVEARLEGEDRAALGGKAHLKEMALTWGMPGVTLHLLVILPNSAKPAPVLLGLNFNGNHEVLPDPHIRIPDGWMRVGEKEGSHAGGESTRGRQEAVWNVALAIEHGIGVATFYNGDVVPDEPALAAERLRLFRPGAGAEAKDSASPEDCATIAAWAWGLSRAADYLMTDPEVDSARLGLVGHSRNGKTALLAGALDERFKVIIPSQAGCGGTGPSRLPVELTKPNAKGKPTSETVEVITRHFPHWFCENFKSFGAAPEKLPFDQHELIALCAPRPVLVSAAEEDLWANPPGQFAMLQAADPVYRLVAGEGLEAQQMPPASHLVPSRLGYFIRPGGHEMNTQDWTAWLAYAERWLK